MMKRQVVVMSLTLVFSLALAMVAFAAPQNPEDAYTKSSEPDTTHNGAKLEVVGGFGCAASEYTYLKWDLSNVSGAVATPNLNLNVTSLVGGSVDLRLYQVDEQASPWSEGSLTWNNQPPLGSIIEDQTAAAGTVTFSSAALATYVNQESLYTGGGDTWAGDNTVSFAIGPVNCVGINLVVSMDSKDGAGTAPRLNLWNSTAVTLSTFHASSDSGSPLIWAGLALAVAALFGLILYRNRKLAN